MDEPLQRLLEAEARAQVVIDAARREHEAIVEAALATARDAEARFDGGRAALRAPFIDEAHARAEQAVGELTRKYGERQRMLRELAARHEREAAGAALALLLDPAA